MAIKTISKLQYPENTSFSSDDNDVLISKRYVDGEVPGIVQTELGNVVKRYTLNTTAPTSGTLTITHNLGTANVVVQVFKYVGTTEEKRAVIVEVAVVSENVVRVVLPSAEATTDHYQIVIVGTTVTATTQS